MQIHDINQITLPRTERQLSTRQMVEKIALCFFLACLTGLAAQIKWYLPNNPVPFTFQTAAVVLSALWLKKWGGLSQLLYLCLGFCGIPWFANQASGWNVLFLPTAGYLIGFVFTAFLGGWLVEKYYSRFRFFTSIGLFVITALFTHGFGILYLHSWMIISHREVPTLSSLLIQGTLPFLGFDFLKIMAVTACYSFKGSHR